MGKWILGPQFCVETADKRIYRIHNFFLELTEVDIKKYRFPTSTTLKGPKELVFASALETELRPPWALGKCSTELLPQPQQPVNKAALDTEGLL